jgi:hypothetical protein
MGPVLDNAFDAENPWRGQPSNTFAVGFWWTSQEEGSSPNETLGITSIVEEEEESGIDASSQSSLGLVPMAGQNRDGMRGAVILT